MKKNITNIIKNITEIGQLLASNSTITRLVCYDTSDALERPIPDVNYEDLVNQKLICLYPPVDNGIENITNNTYLILLLDNINLQYQDNNVGASFTLYITTDEGHSLLKSNKNRLHELLNQVIQTLDGVKLTSSGTLEVVMASHVMITEFRAGYRIKLTITDQYTRKAEI